MFTSTVSSSWDERSRRGLTTLSSFGVQALVVGGLLVLPLLRPAGLPSVRPLPTPVSLGQPLEEAPAARTHASGNAAANNPAVITLTLPTRILSRAADASEDGPPQGAGFGPFASGTAGGDFRGMPNLFENGTRPVLPVAAPPPAVASVRISHMSEGDLVRKILPTYPPLARSARIQG
jgi:hypothetical protein